MRVTANRRGRHWDSELEVHGADAGILTLIFRVRLIQISPDSSSQGGLVIQNGVLIDEGRHFPLQAWETSEWDNFRSNFATVVERAWNNRIWLLPSQPWYRSHPTHPPISVAVRCRVRLTLNDASPHLTFRCVKPGAATDPSAHNAGFRSYASYQTRSGVLTDRALTPHDLSPNSPTMAHHSYRRTTVGHEFGHVLGLGHSHEGQAGCVTDTNAVACYGTNEQERSDMMGYGQAVRGNHARAWIRTIVLHLQPETVADHRLRWRGENIPLEHMVYLRPRASQAPTLRPAQSGTPGSTGGYQPIRPGLSWDPLSQQLIPTR